MCRQMIEAVEADRRLTLAACFHRSEVVGHGLASRDEGEIGFAVMRGGGIVGEHSVSFCTEGEIVTLAHAAQDRSMFARGAIAATLWVAGRPPGEYDMRDVLGFCPRR